ASLPAPARTTHPPHSDAVAKTRSASCDPAALLPPESGKPNPLESASPTSAWTAHSPQKRIATPSTSDADCTPADLLLRRLGRTRSNPTPRSVGECESTGALLAVHPAHDGVITLLAPVHKGSSSAYPFFPHFVDNFKSLGLCGMLFQAA